MRKEQQRAIALQVVRELLPIMGIQPEMVDACEAFKALDELYSTQPQSVAYLWWESASDRQIDLFVDEWEEWREVERAKCPVCREKKEQNGPLRNNFLRARTR